MSPAAAGPSRTVQREFARGMFRSVAPELIPEQGCYDITNGLLDEDGVIYKRGGSAYESAAVLADDVTFLWRGWLSTGLKTIVGTPAGMGVLDGDSFTALTGAGLAAPARPVVMDGKLFLPGGATYAGSGTSLGSAAQAAPFYGVAANRLLAVDGDTLRFSNFGDSGTFDGTDFWQVPGGVETLGVEGLRDSAAWFTTDGLWMVRNLAYNLTDADGNIQQSLDRYSTDLILWGDAGIAGWSGGLVVPALDGVWLVFLGVASEASQPFQRISDPIADLYRQYVAQGCAPGVATVFRGTYVLPVLSSGGVLVDELVCRLDGRDSRGRSTFAWSHLEFEGDGARVLTVTPGESPKLLAGVGNRVERLRWFEPSSSVAADADAGPIEFRVTTRDFPTGPLNENTVLKLRVSYELNDAADNATDGLEAYVATDREQGTEWGLFDWGEADWAEPDGLMTQLTDPDDVAPADPYASAPFTWWVRKKCRFVRFRLVSSGGAARLVVRSLEMFVRDDGRI